MSTAASDQSEPQAGEPAEPTVVIQQAELPQSNASDSATLTTAETAAVDTVWPTASLEEGQGQNVPPQLPDSSEPAAIAGAGAMEVAQPAEASQPTADQTATAQNQAEVAQPSQGQADEASQPTADQTATAQNQAEVAQPSQGQADEAPQPTADQTATAQNQAEVAQPSQGQADGTPQPTADQTATAQNQAEVAQPPEQAQPEVENSITAPADDGAPADRRSVKRSSSRFKVDKVEPTDALSPTVEPPGVQDGVPNETEPLMPEQIPQSPRGVRFAAESEGGGEKHALENEASYGTSNLKSFQADQTVDRIPHIDHYRNVASLHDAVSSRPTMQQLLHGERASISQQDPKKRPSTAVHIQHFERFGQLSVGNGLEPAQHLEPSSGGQKFGWIQGVLMRCALSILGTMLYLRISWVAGAAGLAYGTLVILISTVVIVITCISMCAICTNGEIRGGGAYYMISRSLGPEFGGSIGLIFSFANAVASAMCVVGFAEVIRDMLKNEFNIIIVDGEVNDVRVISYATLALLLCVVIIGVSFESKAQLVLLAVLTLSLVDYLIGTFIPPDSSKKAKGMTGYSWNTLTENFFPDWRDQTFFSVFAVFFPACTGIMAGANISGDLRDPQKAIPKGTLLSILICMVIYTAAIWTCGTTFVREFVAPYNVTEAAPLVDKFLHAMQHSKLALFSDYANVSWSSKKYGLLHNFQVLEISGAWRPLVTAGIYAATLSSALASFVSAPKVFQAVCKDRLFPFIHVFGKGYGANDEPRRGYILAFIIAIAIISIGTLNAIAPIISNFFLMSYALVNYACFDASFAASPGFRPGFRYYNMWVSLGGAILCLAVMFIISWWNALITLGFVTTLYVYVLHRKPDVNWGSSMQAHAYKSALQSALKVASRPEHVKNYRPQILILTGNPVARPALLDFASNITKENSLLICGHVVPLAPNARVLASIDKLSRQIYEWFEKRRVKAFYVGVARSNFRDGVQCILQVAGLGRLKPNVVMLGFKNNWKETAFQDSSNEEYFNVIHNAFENNCGVGILRLQHGLDVSEMMSEHNVGDTQRLKLPEPTNAPSIDTGGSISNLTDSTKQLAPEVTGSQQLRRVRSDEERTGSVSSMPERLFVSVLKNSRRSISKGSNSENDVDLEANEVEMKLLNDDVAEANGEEEEEDERASTPPLKYLRHRRMTKQQKHVINIMDQFKIKVKKALIHVYWLFDDGGLGLLIPHLLTLPRSYLDGAKLNVFTVAASRSQLEKEQRSMAALLSRFRIEYSDVFIIADIAKKPQQDTIKEFESFISRFRVPPPPAVATEGETVTGSTTSPRGYISTAEYDALRIKTYRQLRIRELLQEHSGEATLIAVTLPVPRRGILTSSLYLAWLDFVTQGMPPVLFLRGNQQSVLTFYS